MRRRVGPTIPVLISAKDRPLYLWAMLDNLYRRTRYPHKFILLDMASSDPLVPPGRRRIRAARDV